MILRGVPRNNFAVAGMFSCLASCFNAQGEDSSPIFLRGLWKELFLFTFEAQKAGGAHDWTLFPDFSTTCDICTAMGYSYTYHKDLEWSQAWNFIKEAISQNKPVITTWEPPEIHYPWVCLIVGYDEEISRIYLHNYKRAFDEYPIEEFRRDWEKGKSEQPWLYGAIFTLDEKEREIDIKEVVLQSFKMAVELMKKREATFPAVKGKFREGTFLCGFNAYGELINYLDKEREYAKLDIDALKAIGAWGSCHEAGCEDSKRRFIADYLLYVASEFKGDKRRHIERAADLYREVECLYDNFLLIHPSTTPWGRQGYGHLPSLESKDPTLKEQASKEFGIDMKEAAKIVRKILEKEKKAIQELQKVIE